MNLLENNGIKIRGYYHTTEADGLLTVDNKYFYYHNGVKETRMVDQGELIDLISYDIKPDNLTIMLATPFEIDGVSIYDGDIIGDYVETDRGVIESKLQVFWNDPTGSWHLDLSYEQDKTYSAELWQQLNDSTYRLLGNIYENPELLKNEQTTNI